MSLFTTPKLFSGAFYSVLKFWLPSTFLEFEISLLVKIYLLFDTIVVFHILCDSYHNVDLQRILLL